MESVCQSDDLKGSSVVISRQEENKRENFNFKVIIIGDSGITSTQVLVKQVSLKKQLQIYLMMNIMLHWG